MAYPTAMIFIEQMTVLKAREDLERISVIAAGNGLLDKDYAKEFIEDLELRAGITRSAPLGRVQTVEEQAFIARRFGMKVTGLDE